MESPIRIRNTDDAKQEQTQRNMYMYGIYVGWGRKKRNLLS